MNYPMTTTQQSNGLYSNNSRTINNRQPKLSRKDQQLFAVRNTFNSGFVHGVSPEREHFLIRYSNRVAISFESNSLVDEIKKLAVDQTGMSISKGTIIDALDIMRAEQPTFTPIVYGRSVRTFDGSLFVESALGVVQYRSGESLGTMPHMYPNMGFITPKNSLPFVNVSGTVYNNDKHNIIKWVESLGIPADQRLLIVTWAIHTLLPDTQKILLELTGDYESGKSLTQIALKNLVDPSCCDLVKETPQTATDLYQLAQFDYVISLDEVESLTDKVQSALALLLEGHVIPWKQKQDRKKIEVRATCPVILNSLSRVVTNRELADSTISIEVPPLSDNLTIGAETALAALFSILGDVQAEYYCSTYPSLHRKIKPMDIFCRVGCLVAKSLGVEPQTFVDQLNQNRSNQRFSAIDGCPTAAALMKFMGQQKDNSIESTVIELYESLLVYKPNWTGTEWPKDPKALGAKLRSIKPIMRPLGINIEPIGKVGGWCRFMFSKVPPSVEEFTVPNPTFTPSTSSFSSNI